MPADAAGAERCHPAQGRAASGGLPSVQPVPGRPSLPQAPHLPPAAAGAPDSSQQALPPNATASIYVKNIPPDAGKLYLYEHFAQFGAVLSVRVLVRPSPGLVRALDALPARLHGRGGVAGLASADVSPSRPAAGQQPREHVAASCGGRTCQPRAATQAGCVRVQMDPATNQCRGVGFVNYATPGSALAAVQAVHGQRVGERDAKVLRVSLQTLGQARRPLRAG